MVGDIPFEPRRFQSAAQHYLAGRPAYPPLLIRRVVGLCGLDGTHRVLDLGCGPGQLALAFAAFVHEVTAIDPEPEMLRIAAESAARAKANVKVVEGSSYDLRPQAGRFRLVTIGRAFHWMDRARTLQRLDAIVDPQGAVVLFADRHPEVPDNLWRGDYERLIGVYAEGDVVRARRKSPGWLPHEAILLDSAFARLERVSVIERRRTPVDRFTDRALSLSSTSPGRLRSKADALAGAMRDAMSKFASNGLITEVVEVEALIARRVPTAESAGA